VCGRSKLFEALETKLKERAFDGVAINCMRNREFLNEN